MDAETKPQTAESPAPAEEPVVTPEAPGPANTHAEGHPPADHPGEPVDELHPSPQDLHAVEEEAKKAQEADALNATADVPQDEDGNLKATGDSGNADSKKCTGKKLTDSQKNQKQKQMEAQERRKKLVEEQNNDLKLAEEAAKNSKIILTVECCINCVEHQYCTHHKEEKYREYMKYLKVEIEKQNPDIHVCKNYKIAKPQIGALEVKWKDQVVYSKLKEMKWPNAVVIGRKVKEAREKEAKDILEAQMAAEREAQRKQQEAEAKAKADEAKKKAEEEKKLNAAKIQEIEKTTAAEVVHDEPVHPHAEPQEVDKENEHPAEHVSEGKAETEAEVPAEEGDPQPAEDNILRARDMNQEQTAA